MFSEWENKPKKLVIFSLVCLAITVFLLIWLIIYLDVKPGHKHRIFNNHMVIFLKSAIWGVGIIGGVLMGWGQSLRLRYIAKPNSSFRRSVSSILSGILLCLWSIERLIIGISPEGAYDYLGSIGIKPYGIWYSFDAVIAAVMLIPTATCGAYLIAKGLNPSPLDGGPEH